MNRTKSSKGNCLPWQKALWFVILLLAFSVEAFAQNYVFSGGEAANFGTISLTTSTASPYWGTDRSASPGYWAAVGTATYTNAADVNYNINGYVKWYVNASAQSFTAPVGDEAQLRNLTISGTTAAGDIFATAWWTGSPSTVADPTGPNAGTHLVTSVGTGISSVSPVGFWDWQDLSSSGAGRTITVDIPDMTSFGTAANLRLVGWNGTQWVNLSAPGAASGNTNHSTLAGTMVAGITAIGIGAVLAAVPDLRPLVNMTDRNFVKPTAMSKPLTARIANVGAVGSTTTGVITVFMSVGANFTAALNGSSAWTLTDDGGGEYTLSASLPIPRTSPATSVDIPLMLTAKSSISKGNYNISFTIDDNAGGETNNVNNTVTSDVSVSL